MFLEGRKRICSFLFYHQAGSKYYLTAQQLNDIMPPLPVTPKYNHSLRTWTLPSYTGECCSSKQKTESAYLVPAHVVTNYCFIKVISYWGEQLYSSLGSLSEILKTFLSSIMLQMRDKRWRWDERWIVFMMLRKVQRLQPLHLRLRWPGRLRT